MVARNCGTQYNTEQFWQWCCCLLEQSDGKQMTSLDNEKQQVYGRMVSRKIALFCDQKHLLDIRCIILVKFILNMCLQCLSSTEICRTTIIFVLIFASIITVLSGHSAVLFRWCYWLQQRHAAHVYLSALLETGQWALWTTLRSLASFAIYLLSFVVFSKGELGWWFNVFPEFLAVTKQP